ncbi:MAG: hypothetical protein H7123_08240 [Thermoleophilia bacterium]|nr:hypothetical protein [Thermoleophilia bacterium]
MTQLSPTSRSLKQIDRRTQRRGLAIIITVFAIVAALNFTGSGIAGVCQVDGHRDCSMYIYQYGYTP